MLACDAPLLIFSVTQCQYTMLMVAFCSSCAEVIGVHALVTSALLQCCIQFALAFLRLVALTEHDCLEVTNTYFDTNEWQYATSYYTCLDR